MTTEKEQTEYLRSVLEGISPDTVRLLLSKYADKDKEVRKPKTEHGPVKHFTKFIKNYDCLTCHSSFSTEDQLAVGDSTTFIKPDGTVGQVVGQKNKENISVICITTYCPMCKCRIKLWDRDMLEQRFISLTRLLSSKELLKIV